MQLHQIQPKQKNKTRKRIGRGGKKGTYSGRGMKGQKSRSNTSLEPIVRYLIKRYPKLRGHRQKISGFRADVAVLNLDVLEKNFEAGAKISPKVLLEKGLISKIKGRMPQVKILATGKTKKAFEVSGCEISNKAKELIEKAGGKVNL